MSGHSKWATIKRKKAKTDSARAAEFQKFSREIIVAARLGGGDPTGNFRLRTAIERAKAAGLPNDNIKRAIEKGCGAGSSENYEEMIYEGYAAGGVAVVDSSLIEKRTERTDITACYIPASKLAEENEISGLGNIILLGKLWKETQFCSMEQLEAGLRKCVPAKKAHLVDANLKALEIGINF